MSVRRSVLVTTLVISACGGEPQMSALEVSMSVPLTSDLACTGNDTSPIVAAELFVSGDLPSCPLTVKDAVVSGSCNDIPTGIDRFLVIRYSGAGDAPIRYAVTVAELTPDALEGNDGKVTITFVDDDTTGFFIDSDADVAQLRDLLYDASTALQGAQCFARSVIAADADNDEVAADCLTQVDLEPVLDLDEDGCTNLRELCDGTSPTDASSRSCN